MKLAQSYSRLGTETAFEVLARARALEAQGRKIVHLEIGEPDFDTPANIREAAKKALDRGYTHYGPSAGLPEARKAVAEYVSKTRAVPVAPEETLIVPGGKPILFFSIMALVDPGDEIIYPNPGFPIYESMINYVGGKAVPLPIREENDFDFDPAEFERLLTPKTKLVIVNSPANPTGGVMSASTMERVAKALAKFPNAMLLSDEIYSRIVYEGSHLSLLSLPGMKERTILLDGFSKTWAMTGWRLGYGVGPRWLIDAMAKLSTNDHSCTASFSQMAAIEALNGPQDCVDKMVAEFKRRRDVIVKGLNSLPGVTCRTPKAAFYVFPSIKGTGMKSKALADALLSEAGVACLPGTSFGSHGEGYLRFSYANSVENIEAALAAMKQALPKLAEAVAK
ncbi:MAG: aspartate aminotransferase [Elusimicrobia bacterium GWC2_65_9]|nr:MAG: aspartate aminotransferase [Elusimicrobia bacterium GWA2_66_18]OGR68789.1 MAG: aspartate aminotransferase [Elusimicrobia bacterium GWC2_65_9]